MYHHVSTILAEHPQNAASVKIRFDLWSLSCWLYLVELLQVLKALQDPSILPLPVLPADERGAQLCRSAAVDFLLQGKISSPETVCILVPNLQEELKRYGTRRKGQIQVKNRSKFVVTAVKHGKSRLWRHNGWCKCMVGVKCLITLSNKRYF